MYYGLSKKNIAILILPVSLYAGQVFAQSYSDGFEAATLNSFFTAEGPVTTGLSTAFAHSGVHSLALQDSVAKTGRAGLIR